MSIFLVRHPETTWNVQGRLQGSLEGLVTAYGRKRSYEFAQESSKYQFEYIYTASSKRTKFLAEVLKKVHRKARIIEDIRLNERSFGKLEGEKNNIVAKKNDFNPDDYEKRFIWTPPGGESLKDIGRRVEDFIEDLLVQDDKVRGDIIAVTSGGVIKVALYIKNIYPLNKAMTAKIENLQLFQFR